MGSVADTQRFSVTELAAASTSDLARAADAIRVFGEVLQKQNAELEASIRKWADALRQAKP